MKRLYWIIPLFFLTLRFLGAAETEPVTKPGLSRLQLVTEVNSIQPGKSFTIGMVLHHEAKFHTYWKGPGIVGVATFFEWNLPEGFSAGEVQWPAPEQVNMAALNAYGYERNVCLLTKITVPEKIDSDEVNITVRSGWMACAKSCHPGWHDFSLTLPVNRSGKPEAFDSKWHKIFENNRKSFPKPSPNHWVFTPSELAVDRITLVIDTVGKAIPKADTVYFFSYDNQVDSDEPQKVSVSDNGTKIKIELPRPEFAPEKVISLSGVIYHPDGWPGLGTKWLTLDAPWAKNTP